MRRSLSLVKKASLVAALLGCTSLLSQSAFADPVTWKIEPNHTAANFSVKHLGVTNVNGSFRAVSGKVVIDETDLSKSSVEAKIPVSSVDTGIEDRDNHLRGTDFFDVAKYPYMTFTSTKVSKSSDGENYDVTGTLTLHGVSKTVTLKMEPLSKTIKNPVGVLTRGTSATTKISRKDFGLTWDKVTEGVSVVGDDIKISLDIELILPSK